MPKRFGLPDLETRFKKKTPLQIKALHELAINRELVVLCFARGNRVEGACGRPETKCGLG